jgi:hypothetical protein
MREGKQFKEMKDVVRGQKPWLVEQHADAVFDAVFCAD